MLYSPDDPGYPSGYLPDLKHSQNHLHNEKCCLCNFAMVPAVAIIVTLQHFCDVAWKGVHLLLSKVLWVLCPTQHEYGLVHQHRYPQLIIDSSKCLYLVLEYRYRDQTYIIITIRFVSINSFLKSNPMVILLIRNYIEPQTK